ncbi:hypothetical protein RFI_36953, partial [Reticulomyxa filosa]
QIISSCKEIKLFFFAHIKYKSKKQLVHRKLSVVVHSFIEKKKKKTNENPPAPTTKNVNEEKPQQEETATNEEAQKKTKTQEEMEAKEHWKSSVEAETFQFNVDIAQLMRYFFFKKFLYAKKTKNVFITKKNICTYNKKKHTYL